MATKTEWAIVEGLITYSRDMNLPDMAPLMTTLQIDNHPVIVLG